MIYILKALIIFLNKLHNFFITRFLLANNFVYKFLPFGKKINVQLFQKRKRKSKNNQTFISQKCIK